MSSSASRSVPVKSKIELPDWVLQMIPLAHLEGDLACMELVLELTGRAVAEEAGGPFGALLVEATSGRVLSAGINLAQSSGNPVLHAETVALSLGMPLVDADNAGALTLYSSCEPCVMCMGAVHWAGVQRVVYSALREDAEAVGFNEGEGARELKAGMEARGVVFRGGVMRGRGAQVLKRYVAGGGRIYGPA